MDRLASKLAAVRALRLRDPAIGRTADPQSVLAFADAAGLSLFLPASLFDERGRAALDVRLERNRQRLCGVRQLYRDVAHRLSAAGIPFVFLKGLHQCELSGLDPARRVQYDIDVLTAPGRARDVVAALEVLGFRPFGAVAGHSGEHLPPLIRRTGWEFRGDFFDPEIPTSIEPHFQLWDESALRLAAPGIEQFFERRQGERLAPADALGHTALHLLKHLLLGSVRPFHVYEVACILERQHGNDSLWREWRRTHHPALRRLQCLAFRLSHEWFDCRLPEAAEDDWAGLPPSARTWFGSYSLSPLAGANKDELWLHVALIGSLRDRTDVFVRRLLPLRPPPPVDGIYLTAAQRTWRRRALQWMRQARFAGGRAAHHATSALRLAGSGARWWWRLRWSRG